MTVDPHFHSHSHINTHILMNLHTDTIIHSRTHSLHPLKMFTYSHLYFKNHMLTHKSLMCEQVHKHSHIHTVCRFINTHACTFTHSHTKNTHAHTWTLSHIHIQTGSYSLTLSHKQKYTFANRCTQTPSHYHFYIRNTHLVMHKHNQIHSQKRTHTFPCAYTEACLHIH